METKIMSIGNSKGIIIPSNLLKKLNLKEFDKLEITERKGSINMRRKNSRVGWEEAITKELQSKGQVKKLMPDTLDDESFEEEWT